MSGRAQWLGAVSDFERCFDCKDIRTFTRVKHVRYGWVYFCRTCDDKHEAQSWWSRSSLKLNWSAVADKERVRNQLTARLRRMLSGGRQLSTVRKLELEQLAPLAGDDPKDVLDGLGKYELSTKAGRIRGYGYEEERRAA